MPTAALFHDRTNLEDPFISEVQEFWDLVQRYYACIYLCMYVYYTHIHIYVHMYACMYICMYVCTYIYMYACNLFSVVCFTQSLANKICCNYINLL